MAPTVKTRKRILLAAYIEREQEGAMEVELDDGFGRVRTTVCASKILPLTVWDGWPEELREKIVSIATERRCTPVGVVLALVQQGLRCGAADHDGKLAGKP